MSDFSAISTHLLNVVTDHAVVGPHVPVTPLVSLEKFSLMVFSYFASSGVVVDSMVHVAAKTPCVERRREITRMLRIKGERMIYGRGLSFFIFSVPTCIKSCTSPMRELVKMSISERSSENDW